jgi:hypothetical protein
MLCAACGFVALCRLPGWLNSLNQAALMCSSAGFGLVVPGEVGCCWAAFPISCAALCLCIYAVLCSDVACSAQG